MLRSVERRFFRSGSLRLAYREAGEAAAQPLVLLHPSPRSSAMFEPWMRELAEHFHVFAPDTPGYGGSDPLPVPSDSLAAYLPPLLEWLQQVVGPRAMIYGSATGAQLGIALANRTPESVQHLLLDNAAHFDAEERDWMLAHYFPDLRPRPDGSHLQELWRMARQMAQFFPWFAADEAHRYSMREPTAEEVHATVCEFLAAGPGYAAAYRAAFVHERASEVQKLKVPVTLFRWLGSMLLPHIDRLLAHALPPQLRVVETPAGLPERYAAMNARLRAVRLSLALVRP